MRVNILKTKAKKQPVSTNQETEKKLKHPNTVQKFKNCTYFRTSQKTLKTLEYCITICIGLKKKSFEKVTLKSLYIAFAVLINLQLEG